MRRSVGIVLVTGMCLALGVLGTKLSATASNAAPDTAARPQALAGWPRYRESCIRSGFRPIDATSLISATGRS